MKMKTTVYCTKRTTALYLVNFCFSSKLFLCLCLCLSVFLSFCLSACLSLSLSLSLYLPVCLSFSPSALPARRLPLGVHRHLPVVSVQLGLLDLLEVLLGVCADLYHGARLDQTRDLLPPLAVELQPSQEQPVLVVRPSPGIL